MDLLGTACYEAERQGCSIGSNPKQLFGSVITVSSGRASRHPGLKKLAFHETEPSGDSHFTKSKCVGHQCHGVEVNPGNPDLRSPKDVM